jgi:hypothetical protein
MLETPASALPIDQGEKSKFRDIFEEKQGFDSDENNPQSSDLRDDEFGIGDAGCDPSPIGDSIWFISGLGIAYGMYISTKKRTIKLNLLTFNSI